MSGDLAITAAIGVPTTLSHRTPAAAPQTVTQAASGASSAPPVNPGLHLDPALNLVVLQFYDSKGEVTQSIPSQKQLKAYQQDAGAALASPSQRATSDSSNVPEAG